MGAANNTMTKKDIIDRITERTKLKRTDVKVIVQQFLDEIVSELGAGHRLEFRDFGVFEVRVRAARTAQNPKTLEPVPVPAKHTVKFKPGRKMRDALDAAGASPNEDSLAEVKVTDRAASSMFNGAIDRPDVTSG
ncbi:MAG: integration host factor subunit beta [Phycisphaeraceae bacterium]|nr:MAG: integration host factor subunit beta [Phycisphaeraceae bacterium]